MKPNPPYISLKIVPKHGEVISVGSHKTRRIYHKLEGDKSLDCVFEVSVTYGPGAFNAGTYETKDDLVFALKAFLEPD